MTNPNETMQPSRPRDAFRLVARTAALAGLAAALLVAPMTGCGQEEEAPVAVAPPPPPPPPPPPAPTVTPIAQLMKELGISDKIRLPEEKAPATDPERVAVLKFFDGFAKAKADAVRGAMSPEDVAVLDAMKASGFEKTCTPITRIDLTTTNREGKSYVMAVYRAGGDMEGQLWSFKVAGEGKKVTSQLFQSYVQPLGIMGKLSGTNLIAEWIKVVDADRKVASEPDEAVKPAARVHKQEQTESSGGEGPSGPIGAPPMRNKPPPGGIKPPSHRPGK